MSYRAAVLADHPIAYWRLGETSGPAIDEVSGFHATYTGTPTQGVAGLLVDDANKAVSLATAFARADEIPALEQPAAISFECLVKPANASGGKAFMTLTSLGANSRVVLFTDSGTDLFLQIVNGGGAQNIGPVNAVFAANVKHHVVGTYDSVTGVGKLYVDGALVKTTTITAGAPLTGMEMWLGKATFGYQMAGVEDECAVYDYVLSPTRIAVHFTESLTPSTDNNDIWNQQNPLIPGDKLIPGDPFIAGGLLG